MPYGAEPHTHSHDTDTQTRPRPGQPPARPQPCGCAEPHPGSTCCDIQCFERPRYFCGHLLTDDDLSLEQHYVVEKQKLYHRTLDGHGVVCGLRLTCHGPCSGEILIGNGFAIDECGNDLVVCEPARFDVIARLREKRWLPIPPPADDCEPETPEPDCKIRQCYFVVACYEEEQREFATPLSPSCGSSPKDCEPTRIAETVYFDVVDRLPKAPSPLARLEASIEKCFTLFTASPFGDAVADETVQAALADQAAPSSYRQFFEQFCKLRGLLLLYLDEHPDQYNCTLTHEIRAITFPVETASTYVVDVRQAFCGLLELAYRYVMSCVFGHLTFDCAEPEKASCVLLGTVEVEGDRVIRVCNCPREYVWSFASFFQVLVTRLLGPLACKPSEYTRQKTKTVPGTGERGRQHVHDDDCGCGGRKQYETPGCCRDVTLENCAEFQEVLARNPSAMPEMATRPFEILARLRETLQHALDPTFRGPDLQAFVGLGQEEAYEYAVRSSKMAVTMAEAPEGRVWENPITLLARMLGRPTDEPIVLRTRDQVVVDAGPEPTQARIDRLERELREVKEMLESSGGGPAAPRPGPKKGGGGPTK